MPAIPNHDQLETQVSESNSTIETPIVIDDTAVKVEAARIMTALAAKHNRSVESFDGEVAARAVEQARINLEKSASDATGYKALYEAEKQKRELAEGTLNNIRTSQHKVSSSDNTRPAITAEQARARMGLRAWNALTTTQRVAALGVEPSAENLEAAAEVFGRSAPTTLANDLMKSNPARYRMLREVAHASGSYAN
jgi:hypothetical protein